MSMVPVRELRNNTAAVIERVRNGEDVTISVNGVAAAKLVPIPNAKREYLTTADLIAMAPKPGVPLPAFWEHELEGDTTDNLDSIP